MPSSPDPPLPRSPPPQDRNRSRSPRRDSDRNDRNDKRRSRSRSPPRRPKNYSGFKWKKHDKRDDVERGGDDRGLSRGYRGQDRDRRGGDRDRDERGARGGDCYGNRDREPDRDRDRERREGRDRRDDRDRRGGDRDRDDRKRDRDSDDRRDRDSRRNRSRDRDSKSKTSDKPPTTAPSKPTPAASNEPMILVTINDRLGTKAQIPCLASDPVKVFKAMVAARIGRPAHEIMLKRQGERPFKDHLSLEDYGVSNGVQLDLELDTGD
ncbi:ubiquitin-like protein [Delitschia confertaspora ATCC 74209]|uniref:Ubiquitin-like modifier HUB1 n=1 Tax=Delitschia confertaspora ATCC 74209 TaxID=1513339 RepID=A0A9P4JID5_9PLEO|nr:ubiquitin-like protein [Delitschia confertaspora ATCC 74209]